MAKDIVIKGWHDVPLVSHGTACTYLTSPSLIRQNENGTYSLHILQLLLSSSSSTTGFFSLFVYHQKHLTQLRREDSTHMVPALISSAFVGMMTMTPTCPTNQVEMTQGSERRRSFHRALNTLGLYM